MKSSADTLQSLDQFREYSAEDALVALGEWTGMDDQSLLDIMPELNGFEGNVVFIALPHPQGESAPEQIVSIKGEDSFSVFYRTLFLRDDGTLRSGTPHFLIPDDSFDDEDLTATEKKILGIERRRNRGDDPFEIMNRYLGENLTPIDALAQLVHFENATGTKDVDPRDILQNLPFLQSFHGTISFNTNNYPSMGGVGFIVYGHPGGSTAYEEQVRLADVIFADKMYIRFDLADDEEEEEIEDDAWGSDDEFDQGK